MILIQVIRVGICFVPHGIFISYKMITTGMAKNTNRLVSEGFVLTISPLRTYFYYAVCISVRFLR